MKKFIKRLIEYLFLSKRASKKVEDLVEYRNTSSQGVGSSIVIDKIQDNVNQSKELSWFQEANNLIADFPAEPTPIYSGRDLNVIVGYTDVNKVEYSALVNSGVSEETLDKIKNSKTYHYQNEDSIYDSKAGNRNDRFDDMSVADINKEINEEIKKVYEVEDKIVMDELDIAIEKLKKF